jgi:hypothetical protein
MAWSFSILTETSVSYGIAYLDPEELLPTLTPNNQAA